MRKLLVSILGIVMIFSVSSIYAAGTKGGIRGTVTDSSSGATISGATITLVEASTSDTTDSSGFYMLTLIDAGDYTLKVEASGYTTSEQTVTIVAKSRILVDVALTSASSGDTTSPAPGDSGAISTGNVTETSVELSWAVASDDTSAFLDYKVVYLASDDIDTVTDAEENGTTVTDWSTDLTNATASGLSVSTTYYFNVLVRDDAGNFAAYTSTSATTLTSAVSLTYPIVDTNQDTSYDDSGNVLTNLSSGDAFYGQDNNYTTNTPSYADNGDGTVTDLNTGLMWQQDPVSKQTYDDAVTGAANSTLAGYTDWRMADIKELYSLIDFNGAEGTEESDNTPFIDGDFFAVYYGDTSADERYIDAQYMSSIKYVSTTMNGDETVFGVNFIDGRIKGYPVKNPETGADAEYYALYVRGNEDYSDNVFIDNGDGTITDTATGLMWMTVDSGDSQFNLSNDGGMDWESALDWAQNLTYAGYSDWKLPDAKELQSIVDYTRSPDTTNSAAIDPLFDSTIITQENYVDGYAYYWTSTTHKTGPSDIEGENAAYIAFGEALGSMDGGVTFIDVHGAGCQRSDPKSGDPGDYPTTFGPQGDIQRVFNHVRCVRVPE